MAKHGGGSSSMFSVEGASWLEQLFQMISTRDPEGNQLPINIPDTVVFRYQRPAGLFFTEDGVLRRIDDISELSEKALMSRFSRTGYTDDAICAMYVYRDRQAADPDDKTTKDFTVEYMNKAQLKFFLEVRIKDNNGILQRFVQSRGQHNAIIRVMWTPRRSFVESCQNNHRLDDVRVFLTCTTLSNIVGRDFFLLLMDDDPVQACPTSQGLREISSLLEVPMSEKVQTFDGGPHLTTTYQLQKGILSSTVTAGCVQVVQHVQSLLPKGYHVWETVMYWKFCAVEKGFIGEGSIPTAGLTFLWCSSVRLVRDEVNEVKRLDDFLTTKFESDRVTSKPAPKRKKDIPCCPVSGLEFSTHSEAEVRAGTLLKYLQEISRMRPVPTEALKYTKEARDLDEQNQSEDFIRIYSKGGQNSASALKGEVEEELNILLKYDSKRPKRVADRQVVDVIKRVVFGNTATPTAEFLRAMVETRRFQGYEVVVSEDIALKSAEVVMDAASRPDHFETTPTKRGNTRDDRAAARMVLKNSMAAGTSLGGCKVVEIKNVVVGAPNTVDRSVPSPKHGGVDVLDAKTNLAVVADGRVHDTFGQRGIDTAIATSRIMAIRRERYAGQSANLQELEAGDDGIFSLLALERKLKVSDGQGGRSLSAKERQIPQSALAGSLRRRVASGTNEVKQKKRSLSAKVSREAVLNEYSSQRSGKSKDEILSGLLASNFDPQSAGRRVDGAGLGADRSELQILAGYMPKTARVDSGVVPFRSQSAKNAQRDQVVLGALTKPPKTEVVRNSSADQNRRHGRLSTRVESANRRKDIGDVLEWSDDGIVEDTDEEDWDDGLEMDLPSTRKKFVDETRHTSHRERAGLSKSSKSNPKPSKDQVPLFLQWGLNHKVREKVLAQYTAFSEIDDKI